MDLFSFWEHPQEMSFQNRKDEKERVQDSMINGIISVDPLIVLISDCVEVKICIYRLESIKICIWLVWAYQNQLFQ
jgi:hypothetical protein